jgi:hypothetical protein
MSIEQQAAVKVAYVIAPVRSEPHAHGAGPSAAECGTKSLPCPFSASVEANLCVPLCRWHNMARCNVWHGCDIRAQHS